MSFARPHPPGNIRRDKNRNCELWWNVLCVTCVPHTDSHTHTPTHTTNMDFHQKKLHTGTDHTYSYLLQAHTNTCVLKITLSPHTHTHTHTHRVPFDTHIWLHHLESRGNSQLLLAPILSPCSCRGQYASPAWLPAPSHSVQLRPGSRSLPILYSSGLAPGPFPFCTGLRCPWGSVSNRPLATL